tara:strand:- start:2140 stop:2622 length:483 start_codon:yes stop_codon:yes gene_type:complete
LNEKGKKMTKSFRISILLIASLFAFSIVSSLAIAGAEDKTHRVVIHVDDDDPKRMNMALNNAANANAYYKAKAEPVIIEVVTYGPGLIMLHAAKSPVKNRITSFGKEFNNISFKACGNTHKNMSRKAGKNVALLPEAQIVSSGVVHMIQRQEQGWSYIRP